MAAAKKEKKPIMSCVGNWHITKLKQSIFTLRYLWLEQFVFTFTLGLATVGKFPGD
jgi:hypothetical protein